MNLNEERDALSRLAADNSLSILNAIITCACESAQIGISRLSFHVAQLNAASNALNSGWHFDKKSGKAFCKKCWEAKESKP